MIKQGTGGSIVFTASPTPAAAYSFSKAGLLQLKNSLAAEWAQYGIRVNSISPGYMETRMISSITSSNIREVWAERNPIGDPSELAGPIVLFCSPAGRYITGVDILVDGQLLPLECALMINSIPRRMSCILNPVFSNVRCIHSLNRTVSPKPHRFIPHCERGIEVLSVKKC
jgi:Enoyl-(Acyl carrier protein) reductase